MDSKVAKALAAPPVDTERLLQDVVFEVNATKTNRVRRQAPTPGTVSKLASYFTSGNYLERARRWAGVVLLCFAQEWVQVRDQLSSSTEKHLLFGEIVLHGSEDLKILSTSIIATIVFTKDELTSFWPKQYYPLIDTSSFPLDLTSTSWLEMLNSFIRDSLPQEVSIKSRTPAFSAKTLELSGSRCLKTTNRVLYCIVGGRLTVTFAPPDGDRPFFLEIPYSMITEIDTLQTTLEDSNTKSQAVVPLLRIKLANQATNCVVNAKKQKAIGVKIFLYDATTLEYAYKDLLAAWEYHREPVCQRADVLDASQQRDNQDASNGRATSPDLPAPDEVGSHKVAAGEGNWTNQPDHLLMPAAMLQQRPKRNAVEASIGPVPESTTKSRSKRTSAAEKENEDIFDIPDSGSSGNERSRKKTGKATKNKGRVRSKAAKQTRAGQTKVRGKPPRETLDESQLSHYINRIPKSTCASSRPGTSRKAEQQLTKAVHKAGILGETVADQLKPTSSGKALAQKSETAKPPLLELRSTASRQGADRGPVLPKLQVFEAEVIDYDAEPTGETEVIAAMAASNKAFESQPKGEEASKKVTVAAEEISKTVAQVDVAGSKTRLDQTTGERSKRPSFPTKVSNRHTSLIDERSMRKANFVSFGKSGPKNQGRRSIQLRLGKNSVLQQEVESPLLPSCPLKSHHNEQDVRNAQQDLRLPKGAASGTCANVIGSETLRKCPQTTASRPFASKRRRVAKVLDDGHDFVPTEHSDFESKQKPVRRASQWNVRITDEGSPILEAAEEDAETRNAPHILSDMRAYPRALRSSAIWQGLNRDISEKERLAERPEPEASTGVLDLSEISRSFSPSVAKPKQRIMNKTNRPKVDHGYNLLRSDRTIDTPKSNFVQLLAKTVDQKQGPFIQSSAVDRQHKTDVDSDSFTDIEIYEGKQQKKAREKEWEDSLAPRHRDILDLLRSVSHRFVDHIIEWQTAITNVIEDYFKDNAFLLSEFDRKHIDQLRRLQKTYRDNSSPITLTRTAESFLKNEHSKLRNGLRS